MITTNDVAAALWRITTKDVVEKLLLDHDERPHEHRRQVREAGGYLGMYARVSRPGMVTIGDAISPID